MLHGRLTDTPRLSHTSHTSQHHVPVADADILVNRRVQTSPDHWDDATPTRYRIKAWRQLATNIATLPKGTEVLLVGYVETDTYTDHDGNPPHHRHRHRRRPRRVPRARHPRHPPHPHGTADRPGRRRRMTCPCETDKARLARPLLTPAETAHELGISLRALADLRRHGRGPRYIRLTPATIRYLRDDVQGSEAASVEPRYPCADTR